MELTKLDIADTADKEFSSHVEDTVNANKTGDDVVDPIELVRQEHGDLYAEALERYGQDNSIDPEDEKRLKRKLDRRIIPLLGICYFFYVSIWNSQFSRGKRCWYAGYFAVCGQDHIVVRCNFWYQGRP